jgi:hypothetical protein
MSWRPPRRPRPRDQWGQFRSKADVRAEQEQARFDSLRIAIEGQYWIAQEEAGEEP